MVAITHNFSDILERIVVIFTGKIHTNLSWISDFFIFLLRNDVCIETDESGKTNIECEQIQCSIKGRKGDDFSHLPEIEKENKITLSQFDLKEVIRQTIFASPGRILLTSDKVLPGTMTSILG